ncbi:hypothetical protein DXG03_009709 [Asterophora parasitica]|uniref:Major facilitator superfamily (MFS) profile domain-containing protein n=1 Tax=Asterophora parasitica TaxID=117018 RepID=A0A9P7GAI8_9AGAR|nr:hypothetical protein DXG03_009709 [Asterophora parasitica]
MGGLMFVLWGIRFFLFKLWESPKYLMGRGRDEEAVDVVHKVAEYNGKTSTLTLEDLKRAGTLGGADDVDTTAKAAVSRQLQKFDSNHVKNLFATRKLAYSTSFLATRGADFGDGSLYTTYRNVTTFSSPDIMSSDEHRYPQQVILSVIGVPGALIAGYLVEIPYLGRRGTLSIATLLTGVFILVSTTARTSNALLGWTSAYSFVSNIMYGVLYAITPELFPTKDRGTGNAIVAAANRVFGIMSPIIALEADLTSSVPIFIAGAIFLVSGFIALLLPFESRGRASL